MAVKLIAEHSGQGPQPWVPTSLHLETVRLSYDAEFDSLGLMFGAKRAGSTLRRDDGVSWRIDPSTGELYGVEIEAFERHFLQAFEDDVRLRQRIQGEWDALKAGGLQDDESRTLFARDLLRSVGLIDDSPAAATHSSRE